MVGSTLAALLGELGEFDAVSLEQLRERRSFKWTAYPPDVLPAFVAEMDFPLVDAVAAALHHAIAIGDCGYAGESALPELFSAFADRLWGWRPDPGRTLLVPDVMAGVARCIEILTAPGDGVVFTPPVYPPFRRTIARLGRRPEQAPMAFEDGRWKLDLDAVAERLAAGANAVLLCHPHNPTGSLPTEAELRSLRELAAGFGAGIISDEVHAPLTLPGRRFVPLLSLGDGRALAVTSASKTWNIPGLKCALVVGGDADTAAALAALPPELSHPGHLGVLAAIAAYSSFLDGDGWIAALGTHLQRQHERTEQLLSAALPPVEVAPVDAGYLRWLDCRPLGLRDDPAATFLAAGKVALSPGLEFGAQGAGFARLNVGTSGPLLAEAIARMAAATTAPAARFP